MNLWYLQYLCMIIADNEPHLVMVKNCISITEWHWDSYLGSTTIVSLKFGLGPRYHYFGEPEAKEVFIWLQFVLSNMSWISQSDWDSSAGGQFSTLGESFYSGLSEGVNLYWPMNMCVTVGNHYISSHLPRSREYPCGWKDHHAPKLMKKPGWEMRIDSYYIYN